MKNRVHILGASGSGMNTIASASVACAQTGYRYFDSDSYFWHTTAEPFTSARPKGECQRLMESDLHGANKWGLSGSLTGWNGRKSANTRGTSIAFCPVASGMKHTQIFCVGGGLRRGHRQEQKPCQS